VEIDEILRQLSSRFPRRARPRPEQSALLVVDMQEHFRPMAGEILPRLVELIAVCRRQGLPVIFTRHAHRNKQADGGMLAQWWGQVILADTPDARLMPEIAPLPGEKVIAKNRYSAFYGTDLEEHLRRGRIKDLLIGGVMTNLCCETTARDAFVRDHRVFFLADGTATAAEEFQRATLTNLSFGFAYLVTCRQIIRYLVAMNRAPGPGEKR
jgi:isochorismate hydrolase